MQRELNWLATSKKEEEKPKMEKITAKELEDFLREDPVKTEENSLDNLENSWRGKTQPETSENKNERKTGSSCSACGGEVIEKSFIPFIGNIGIYGSGGENQATEADRKIDGYHCGVCGIVFLFLPPKDLLKAKSEK